MFIYILSHIFQVAPGSEERHWIRDGSGPWQRAEAGGRRDLNGPQSGDGESQDGDGESFLVFIMRIITMLALDTSQDGDGDGDGRWRESRELSLQKNVRSQRMISSPRIHVYFINFLFFPSQISHIH